MALENSGTVIDPDETIASMTSRRVRVLLVADQPADVQLVRALLARSRHPVFELKVVSSLAEALSRLEESLDDLVLLDLSLPDSQGMETLNAVREIASELPVVVLTATEDEPSASEALKRGAEDYIVKGELEARQLLRAIRYAQERFTHRREMKLLTRELRDANALLERLAVIDPLSEVLNRRGLERALARSMELIDREGVQVTAVLMDLDRFKAINESFGHNIGDLVLVEVAQRLRESVRQVDEVGRLGGDEFLALLVRTKSEELERICDRLQNAISRVVLEVENATIELTASLAAIPIDRDMPSLDVLVSRLHQLLQESKQEGPNRSRVAGAMATESAERISRICRSIANGEGIFNVIQPIMRLSDQQVVGFELLSRFRNGKVEMPDAFFRYCAERNMLIIADHVCLKQSVASASALPRSTRRHINLFPSTILGLSPRHLLDLFPDPEDGQFCIEISEQQIIGNITHLQERLELLREAGLLLACDDVGFGRSHLESLIALEPDVIKIDKRLVRGTADDSFARRRLARLIRIARELEAEIIAEGIESAEDLRVLEDLGVDQGQGYLWGIPGEEFHGAVAAS